MPSEDAASAPSWFDRVRFDELRAQRPFTWGRPLRLLDETASTNDLALQGLEHGDKTGIVWIARHQTGGRGRRGNAWLSPAGENLTLSILLRVPGPAERASGFPLLVGLSVRAVIAQRLADASWAQVKWPNDVLVSGKKLAGILVESRMQKDGQLGLVVGIGLNVHTTEFPLELPGASSLALQGVSEAGREFEALLAALLVELEARTKLYLARGTAALLDELHLHDFLAGRRLRVGEQLGVAAGFDEHGRLLLLQSSGEVQAAVAGHVELIQD